MDKEKIMKAQDLMEIVKGFEEMSELIKTGEMNISELEEILLGMETDIDLIINETLMIMEKENPTAQEKMMKMAIESKTKEENKDFDYEEHKKLTLTILEMTNDIDVNDIKKPLLLPFVENTFKKSDKVLRILMPDMAKAVRKAIKKFHKIKVE